MTITQSAAPRLSFQQLSCSACCEKTKESVLKLGNEGRDTLHVKGKLVNCGEGEELFIDTANKI